MTCPQDQQEHGGQCCKKCQKGTHVSVHCQNSKQTECEPCPDGYFTEMDHYLEKCLPCASCDSSRHLQSLKSCTKESNTRCWCMEGYYCTQTSSKYDCEKCEPISLCPPGHGVSVPPNSMHDTVCKPCPAGTFNNKKDSLTPCLNHTSCSDLGQHLISHGTAEKDAQCGHFVSGCSWIIPASLWAGLILTLILVTVGVVCLKSKRKGKAVITSVSSENFGLPALPPDVITYPTTPELETLTHNNGLCAVEDVCTLECDGVSMTGFSEKCGTFSIQDTCMSFISEPFRSEPQEDDWPGL